MPIKLVTPEEYASKLVAAHGSVEGALKTLDGLKGSKNLLLRNMARELLKSQK